MLTNPGGAFSLQLKLEGRTGTDDLDILPASPSPAPPLAHGDVEDVSIRLQLGESGRTFCLKLGGDGGGVAKVDNARLLKMVASAAAPAQRPDDCP